VKYVLDTNALSALLRGDATAAARLKATPRRLVGVPAPVIAEIEYGIARLPRSKRRQRLAERFELFRSQLHRIPWTDEVSAQFGAIKFALEKRGERIEDFDIAIAAHAKAINAILVTADRTHMKRIKDLAIEDWTSV
jgi:tRNA(fMet)-specific endonuclease VapC